MEELVINSELIESLSEGALHLIQNATFCKDCKASPDDDLFFATIDHSKYGTYIFGWRVMNEYHYVLSDSKYFFSTNPNDGRKIIILVKVLDYDKCEIINYG